MVVALLSLYKSDIFEMGQQIKTHGSVSAAKKPKIRKTKKNTCGQPVCYLCDRSSSRSQPIVTQKLWYLFLPNLHILMSPYTVPYIPNLKEIAPAVPEIRVPEILCIFLLLCIKQ